MPAALCGGRQSGAPASILTFIAFTNYWGVRLYPVVIDKRQNNEIELRAAGIEREFGPDVEEAVIRWEDSGASLRNSESSSWLSVAFIFARRLRSYRDW